MVRLPAKDGRWRKLPLSVRGQRLCGGIGRPSKPSHVRTSLETSLYEPVMRWQLAGDTNGFNPTKAVVMTQTRIAKRLRRFARAVAVAAASYAVASEPSVAQTSPPDRTPVRPAVDPPGALPFDLAFDTREFLWSSTLSVARDGRRVAYVIRRPPGTVNLSSRFQPNGTPSSVVGGKVYVTDRGAQARTTEVCPGGSCWAPSLSPNGELLAFYADKEGPPQLWIFDVASGRSRKLSPIRIKAKLWTGDEAQWSPDSRTVYVPTAPDTGDAAWLPKPDTTPAAARPNANEPAVSVLRGGSE